MNQEQHDRWYPLELRIGGANGVLARLWIILLAVILFLGAYEQMASPARALLTAMGGVVVSGVLVLTFIRPHWGYVAAAAIFVFVAAANIAMNGFSGAIPALFASVFAIQSAIAAVYFRINLAKRAAS